jgi:hypothetical protein
MGPLLGVLSQVQCGQLESAPLVSVFLGGELGQDRSNEKLKKRKKSPEIK